MRGISLGFLLGDCCAKEDLGTEVVMCGPQDEILPVVKEGTSDSLLDLAQIDHVVHEAQAKQPPCLEDAPTIANEVSRGKSPTSTADTAPDGETSTRSNCAATWSTSTRGGRLTLEPFVRKKGCDPGVHDDYELLEEIAKGGFARLWLGRSWQARLASEVALKKVSLGGEGRASFRLECSILRRLDHPHICKLLEVYEESREGYMVMEYCQSGTLLSRISPANTKFDEDVAANVVGQVANAVGYIHGLGVAHRDLKLENICIWRWDPLHVKLIDFGLAYMFSNGCMRGRVGSLDYAAPEVLCAGHCQSYTSACDLWSLGVMTYALLSGKIPFWGTTEHRLGCIRRGQFPLSGGVWDTVSRASHDFVKSLLKWDPAARLRIPDILVHRFLLQGKQDNDWCKDSWVTVSVLNNLRKFAATSGLFRACAVGAARRLDQSEFEDACHVFRLLDIDCHGFLDIRDVERGFARSFVGHLALQSEELDHIITRLQPDEAGRISFTVFCAASLGNGANLSERAQWAAFQALGATSDGKLSKGAVEKTWHASGAAESLFDATTSMTAAAQLWQACKKQHSDKQRVSDDGDERLTFGQFAEGFLRDFQEDAAGQSVAATIPGSQKTRVKLSERAGFRAVARAVKVAVGRRQATIAKV